MLLLGRFAYLLIYSISVSVDFVKSIYYNIVVLSKQQRLEKVL